jgi:hypothetical protein
MGEMADICTCGAELPEGALFCHKCGRPQREIVEPEPIEKPPVTAPPVAPPVTQAGAVNFRNPLAMRVALLVAVSATVMGLILPVLNWLAAGFFAVFFYCRKTGSGLNVGGGVKLGWITGVLMFGPWALIIVPQQLAAIRSGKLAAVMQAQLPAHDPAVDQMLNALQSGPGLAGAVIFALIAFFFFITGLSMAGGALGAKMVGRS